MNGRISAKKTQNLYLGFRTLFFGRFFGGTRHPTNAPNSLVWGLLRRIFAISNLAPYSSSRLGMSADFLQSEK